MKHYVTKTAKFKIESSEEEGRVVKGYASVFNNLDSDDDTIKKGAFKRTIKAMGPEGRDAIKLLAQHDGKRPIGKMLLLKEDEHGLYMEAQFGTHQDGEDYYRMVKEGIINEFSVGFSPVKYKQREDGGYDFNEVKLFEVSAVTIAANPEAVVTEVKSNDIFKTLKRIENKELAHELERDILKMMSESQETTTQLESDLAVKQDSEVEKQDDILNQLLKLYK